MDTFTCVLCCALQVNMRLYTSCFAVTINDNDEEDEDDYDDEDDEDEDDYDDEDDEEEDEDDYDDEEEEEEDYDALCMSLWQMYFSVL